MVNLLALLALLGWTARVRSGNLLLDGGARPRVRPRVRVDITGTVILDEWRVL